MEEPVLYGCKIMSATLDELKDLVNVVNEGFDVHTFRFICVDDYNDVNTLRIEILNCLELSY